MKIYKIRNDEGLFSTGGLTPRWRKVGKTWTKEQNVLSHLNMILNDYKKYGGTYIYRRSELIEYEVKESNITSVRNIFSP